MAPGASYNNNNNNRGTAQYGMPLIMRLAPHCWSNIRIHIYTAAVCMCDFYKYIHGILHRFFSYVRK